MRLFGVLLLLLTCQLVTSTPIFDRDGASLHREYRSAVGDTIRDWFRIIKNRVVGKLHEWFGNDDPTPTFTAQDILNIDKTIGSRISGYPGLFLDLFTGYDYSLDSDSDEWLNGGDMRPLIPNLPSTPILGINWTPNWIPNVQGIPDSIPPAITTPKIESTTLRQTSQTVDETEAVVTSTESHLTTSEEPTVTSAEPISFTTRLITTFTDSIVAATERIFTSGESVVTNNESSTSSMLTSTVSDVNSTESTITEFTVTSESTSSESSTESATTDIESVVTSTEEILTTEPPTTSTESILPIYNKRIEDNEIVTRRTTQKPRPASAEVIF
ncbi:flocculation protein FLO11-like isoform X2 [Pseudomyrmex gracilis]|uniref:flocculation protein FLO11-like isoform X2 n=1 Tax=Pseudomyrmex gracilis TaxID=219809 RepID=UPI000995AB82|nr:flocculation protein FLO11-like isoform X2 [Pseudomyrmex gracilis]